MCSPMTEVMLNRQTKMPSLRRRTIRLTLEKSDPQDFNTLGCFGVSYAYFASPDIPRQAH